eukprot:3007606-Amphidinium_carterae.1
MAIRPRPLQTHRLRCAALLSRPTSPATHTLEATPKKAFGYQNPSHPLFPHPFFDRGSSLFTNIVHYIRST